jgi:hypothetical protein
MPDQFLPRGRLKSLNKRFARPQRTHRLIAAKGETKADLELHRDRMIAQGRAHPDDTFIYRIIVWMS